MKNTSLRLWRRKSVVVVLACILLLASGLGYLYYAGILRVEVPKVKKDIVGVIRVEGPILSSQNASQYTDVINHAMINETVKAVVLVVNSPGGYADLIEQIYLDILELKEKKPLAVSVVSALSGGYYISVASDYIYVCPTSMVGNVGVIGVAPPTLIPSEWVLETGAYKVTGFSKLLFPYNLSRALDSFVSAVESGRGDRLKLSPTQLRRGMVYMGSEAVTVGLADEVGSLQKAIGRVAEGAGLVEYDVVDLTQVSETASGPMSSSNHTSAGWGNLTIEILNRLHPPPAIYYLYLPPGAFTQGLSSTELPAGNLTANVSAGKGKEDMVLVDSSHGNKVSWWELDILIWELVKRNMTVRFVSQWDELESALNNASALIVASPTEPYSVEESERVEEFVDDGRMLLLFFDPTVEYVEIPALFGPINFLSTRFGLSFAKGYLYNEEEHYGIYRNIYVRRFANSPLTQNLTSLVLFTATHIHSVDKGVAWASEGTYSSAAERTGKYPVIALVEDNGTVAAFGDLTFLREPYCYLEDNYQLILNLASAIAGVEVLPAPPTPEEEITRPDLPVGTEKNYTERMNEEEHLLRWLKVSELEIRVEGPDQTTHYYYDEEGSLLRWVSNGMETVYETPIPEEPYPLTKGESWKYESSYTLTMEEEYQGMLAGEEEVVGFEDVMAEDGESYLCAKVRYRLVDQLMKDGTNITIVTTGHSWISTEAGLVKEEGTSRYYVDGVFAGEEKRELLLKSIKKG